jgi:hypothetical protein
VARITPTFVKRLHQRLSEARFERRSAGFARDWVREHGSIVRHGPFQGLSYLPERASVPVLAGTYEAELHGVVADWIAHPPRVAIDVGCSDGYYAVGLARELPDTTVYAFDIDPGARERCRALAELNGVSERVVIESECTPGRLMDFCDDDVCLLVDCEGCELGLLRPDAAPVLRGWRLLVELHDFVNPGISAAIVDRFGPTHDVRLIDELPRERLEVAELAGLPPGRRTRALDERRPDSMRWADLIPRGA